MSTYVDNYSKNHSAYIYFSDGASTIKLPAFLSDFSINMSINREKVSKLTNDYTVYKDLGVTYSYNFTIDIPFYNREEAISGKNKIQTLENMIRPSSGVRTEEYVSKGIKVLFRNLINNGSGISSVKTHGASVVLNDINIEYNTDFGFFDKSKKFYSKLYTISFNAQILVVKQGFKDICHGFEATGDYNMDDVQWWPFQLEKENHNYRSPNTYEKQYISGHNAKITFSHVSKKRSVTVNAFIDNFSKTNSYEFQKHNLGSDVFSPKEIKEISYKFLINFPANNKSQAEQNMIMAQKLFRILAPPKIAAGHSYATTMAFANLVDSEPIYVNSITLKVDTDMGFFDRNKRFYIKNFTIDINAEKGLKTLEKVDDELSSGSTYEESPSPSEAPRSDSERLEDIRKENKSKLMKRFKLL